MNILSSVPLTYMFLFLNDVLKVSTSLAWTCMQLFYKFGVQLLSICEKICIASLDLTCITRHCCQYLARFFLSGCVFVFLGTIPLV